MKLIVEGGGKITVTENEITSTERFTVEAGRDSVNVVFPSYQQGGWIGSIVNSTIVGSNIIGRHARAGLEADDARALSSPPSGTPPSSAPPWHACSPTSSRVDPGAAREDLGLHAV